ncbi:MAG: hypothetical protein C0616_14165 [Desulfuromonas sp.]|nr:MAG: hypothetical protein C0616_14165 [Desulfuromonas sp.]
MFVINFFADRTEANEAIAKCTLVGAWFLVETFDEVDFPVDAIFNGTKVTLLAPISSTMKSVLACRSCG